MLNSLRPFVSLAMLGLAASVGTANAGVRVNPMSYDLQPSGSKARQDLRVENTSATPTAVEVRVERREIEPDGTDKRSPADDDFLIFPPQGILPANGFQTFRVEYVGDPAIKGSRLYLITIAQLPVSATGGASSGIQIVYNVGTLAAVSPVRSSANIEIRSVKPASDAKKIEVEVINSGDRYARLRDGAWTLTGGDGKQEVLEGESLRNAIDNSLIEPGKIRIVQLPISEQFKREGSSAAFQLSPER